MAMGKRAVFIVAVVAMAALAGLEAATVHPVGGAGKNWDTSGDYDTWSAQQKFNQGDSLVFTYPSSHDVVQTTKAGYDACSAGSTDKSFTGGKTTIKLSTAGKQYFICGVPGHCAAGMKLVVNVVAATPTAKAPAKPRGQRAVAPAGAPATAPAPAPASTDDQLPTVTSPTGSPTPKPSAAATIAAGAKAAAVALAVAMAAALAI